MEGARRVVQQLLWLCMQRSSPAIACPVQIVHPHLSHLGFSLGGGAVCGTDKGIQFFPMSLGVLLSCCLAFLLSGGLVLLRPCCLAVLLSCCLAVLRSCVLAVLRSCFLAVLLSCCLAFLLSCCLAFLRSCCLAVLHSCALAVLLSCSLAVLRSCVLPVTVLQLNVSIAHARFVPAAYVSGRDN